MGRLPNIIIRHRENKRKCTLTPLVGRPDFIFMKDRLFLEEHPGKTGANCPGRDNPADAGPFDVLKDCIFLHIDGPLLTAKDAGRRLLLLDASWRRALKLSLHPALAGLEKRSLSGFVTAYPRVSKIYPMPLGGLASIEALYIARLIQGREDMTLLDGYYWKDKFLELNREMIAAIRSGK